MSPLRSRARNQKEAKKRGGFFCPPLKGGDANGGIFPPRIYKKAVITEGVREREYIGGLIEPGITKKMGVSPILGGGWE